MLPSLNLFPGSWDSAFLKEALRLLEQVNLVNTPFSESLSTGPAPLDPC